jgi:hypothetical protein
MSLLYTNDTAAVKRQLPKRPSPRLPGNSARALRALLKLLHPTAPADKGGSERAALEMIEDVYLLDPKARYLLLLASAELIRLSN